MTTASYSFLNSQAPPAVTTLAVFTKEFTAAQVASFSTLLTTGVTIVNIKTDYGAPGNNQKITALVTIAPGQTVLQINTSHFVSGDIGKKIVFGPQDGGPSLGGVAFLTTIVAPFIDGTHVNIANAYSGPTYSATSTFVEWSSDDGPAFAAFKADFQGQSNIVLQIPDGRYANLSVSLLGPGFGIKGLTIEGIGGSPNYVLSDMLGTASGFFLGSTLSVEPAGVVGTASARTQSASAGSTTITLKNSGDAALFSVGTWALMTGLDLQGFGSPSNQQFFEYVFITGISGAVISIQSPLKSAYKSTWPVYFAGDLFHPDLGGPATLYAVDPAWDADHTYNDMQLDQYSQTGSGCRSVIFNRGSSTGFGIFPSTQHYFEVNNWTQTDHGSEIDKLTEHAVYNNCTFHSLALQQPAPQLLELTNFTVLDHINGGGLKTVFTGGNIASFSAGPTSYGSAIEIVATNTVFGEIIQGGFGQSAIQSFYTISGGIWTTIKNIPVVTNSSTASGNPVLNFAPGVLPSDLFTGGGIFALGVSGTGIPPGTGISSFTSTSITLDQNTTGVSSGATLRILGTFTSWAIPGSWVYLGGDHSSQAVFKVLDVYPEGDDSRLHISTSLTGGLPFPVPNSGNYGVTTIPATKLTFSGCTGCPAAVAWSLAPAGNPIFSYWKQTFTGNISTTGPMIPMVGKVVSIKFTVNSAYTGGTFNLDGPFVENRVSNTSVIYNPVIDLTHTGLRTVTLSGVTGTVGSDATLGLPSNDIWLIPGQITAKMVGATGSGNITLEMITDQGIAGALPDPPVIVSFAPNAGGIDPTSTVTLNGTAEAGSTITVYIGASNLGTTTANGSGNWSFVQTNVSNGTYMYTATATDANGTSGLSSPFSVTVFAVHGTSQRGFFFRHK